jgi:glucose-1-phosphate adenylyltransferase
MPSLNEILAVILGGGRGARLFPLTLMRSKPAVPIAGKYRLIDIPISNCINSHIYKIAVLTQFNSVSLHRHISRTYQYDAFHTGWVQVWAAEQTLESADWYQGTADAVRKQLFEIRATGASYVLILAGDHLYRMDYAAMAKYHWDTGADVTVAVQPVNRDDASRFGLLKRESDGRITAFVEKPKDPAVQQKFISRDDPERPFLGSMGIYLFKTQVLVDLLKNYPRYDDFGNDIIPEAINSHKICGFDFDDYWRDIGTMRAFYETNLELASPSSPFNFYDPVAPIYTHPRFLPGSTVEDSQLQDVLLSEGVRILRSEVIRSVLGIRAHISPGCVIRNSIIMGSDFYDTEDRRRDLNVPIGIGRGAHIEGAILDKNARIGEGVVIRPFPRDREIDNDNWFVRDGIVVIPKDAELPAGMRIEPEKQPI